MINAHNTDTPMHSRLKFVEMTPDDFQIMKQWPSWIRVRNMLNPDARDALIMRRLTATKASAFKRVALEAAIGV